MDRHIINIGYMKQQEILRKIGNILKELNEQYEYLHAEEAHLNDLELELFAANAKFLTDHTEILRKINAQQQNVTLNLPEHTETAAAANESSAAELLTVPPTPETETSLPPLAESAVTFDDHSLPQENEYVPAEENQEPVTDQDFSTKSLSYETPEPEIAASHPFEQYLTQPQVDDLPLEQEPASTHVAYNVTDLAEEPDFASETDIHNEFAPVNENTFTATHHDLPEEPAVSEHEQQLHIGPSENDTYDFIRHDPQVSNHEHTFSLSSHTGDEPAPPHVDLSAVEEPEVPAASIHRNEAEQPPENVNAPAPEPEQPLTLNERLSAQLHPQKPAHIPPGQAVSDIKAAISLNDKLLFVKDLFNGYGMAYGEAIELLNRYKTFDEADRFLKTNYVIKNSWGDKPDTVDKFYAVLHRRFPA